MRIRESGMPAMDAWEAFFDVGSVLDRLLVDSNIQDLLEFGCGYGTFTLAAASRISGKLYALDLEPAMLATASQRAIDNKVENIRFESRDFVDAGSGLADQSVEYAMLFNILHTENPLALLSEAYRNLKSGGLLGIMHWIHDAETPRGPPLAIRPRAEQCYRWAIDAGFTAVTEILDLPPFHYGMVMQR